MYVCCVCPKNHHAVALGGHRGKGETQKRTGGGTQKSTMGGTPKCTETHRGATDTYRGEDTEIHRGAGLPNMIDF